ncbi:MAG: prolyl oligopeptidase family serine peptidase [Gemmatimonadota bacterium]
MSRTSRGAVRSRSFLPALLLIALSLPATFVAPTPFTATPLRAQQVDAPSDSVKPPIIVDDYGPWKRITSVALSPDGDWMSYILTPLEGDDSLYVKELDGQGSYVVGRGAAPAFSPDSRWVAYLVMPPEREGNGEHRRPNGPPQMGRGRPARAGGTLVLRNLATGDSIAFADVASLSFPANTHVLLVRKRGPGRDAGYDGADLVVYDLATGTSLNLGNVSEYAVNKPGTQLAYLVDAKDDAGNGAYLLGLASRRITPLATEVGTYARLTWNEDGTALAFLAGTAPEGKEHRQNVLVVIPDASRPTRLERLDPSTVKGFPDGFVLSELGTVSWSKDSKRVFLGIKEQADKREKLEGRANVDVWHWKDVEPQSVQMARANRERDHTWNSVVNVGRHLSFVRLADSTLESVSQSGTSRWGIGEDPTPYQYQVQWGFTKADYYRVDLDDGGRELMAKDVGRQMGSSPDGAWWLYLRDQKVIARNLASGKEVDLTASSGVDFVNRQDDHPYELPIYGVAGWSKDGSSVVLYDRYDVWQVPLDGSKAANLTAGVGGRDSIQFRVVKLEGPRSFRGFRGFGFRREPEEIDLSKPLLLSAYGEWTKKSGYWQVTKGGEPKPLIWLDKAVGRPIKADSAQRIAFTEQTFVEFPDYWVSDARFDHPRKVTDANPQQADFAWSPGRVLNDYVDKRGNHLQATLGLPAGYQKGKRYPMLVYFYEKMSQNHHMYMGPTYDDRPHMATYASNGYLVLNPDIVYTIGRPGSSALDDITAAVQKVIDLGYADPKHIGLQGHSWGGYQSSYVVTQTNMFAAVVTGAPPTDLPSFYNSTYGRTGTIQQGITEVGQVRMGTTPFDSLGVYIDQSPVFNAQKITTPFLILQGTADNAVDWHQGLEYYAMARRLGKHVIFLSYPAQPHHLSSKEDRIDFQIRMMEFFNHYLKGTPAAKWMVDGVPFLDKDYADPRALEDGTMWGHKPEKKGRTGRSGPRTRPAGR